MSWRGRLDLRYRHEAGRTVAHDRHEGPLRVLQTLYPEGDKVAHHVLVHPPGGIVGGDELDVCLDLAEGAHALVTTPGATRFYRSAGPVATQRVVARLAPQARLEWLPLETLVYDAARARNDLRFELAPGAQMIGWDVLALGLPASGQPFRQGRYEQQIELPDLWVERSLLDVEDPLTHRRLASPLGWDGRAVLATMWFASAAPLEAAARQILLEGARGALAASPLVTRAGATSPDGRVVVLRLLAERTEPAFAVLQTVWASWRETVWHLPAVAPRIWRM
ncbi:MAG TPA: urease accessory protein UreD [Burkholderiaceae bacterium]|nr:urease accessory protein UreD [Burkholderiaceae bacterium]